MDCIAELVSRYHPNCQICRALSGIPPHLDALNQAAANEVPILGEGHKRPVRVDIGVGVNHHRW